MLLLLCAAGCGTTAPPAYDASGPSLPSCPDPVVVDAIDGETVSARLDTTGGPLGTIPAECIGGPAPQAVVAVNVPGTGPHAVTLSTVNAGTDSRFDTLLIVRRNECWPRTSTSAPLACFDDETASRELRSRGTVLAEGGDVLYVVVTGYGLMSGGRNDEGLAQLDVTTYEPHAPTLESASILVTPESLRVTVTAGDVDLDAAQVRVTFHGPAGELLDLDASGAGDEADVRTGAFDRPVAGVRTFTETASLGISTAEHDVMAGASSARIVVVDAAGLASETARSVPIATGVIVGPGAACSASEICAAELVCAADMTCQPAPDRVAACALAQAITIPMPMGTAETGTGTALLGAGAGLFSAQCLTTSTGGLERIFSIEVPTGAWDLSLTTDSSGTAGADPLEPDTVLYARRACADSSVGSATPEWCNDDIERGENQRSAFEIRDVAPGTLFVFVELFGASAPTAGDVRVEVAATLRPVLSTGATCDPSGIENRCAGGPCPVATRLCP